MSELCATFRHQSGLVWNRMQKASLLGMALSEETITESVLYEIALAHRGRDIAVTLATKPQEARHGADWEWWLVRGNVGVSFRVQAKRLFPDGKYQGLFKRPPHDRYDQLSKLVSAARYSGHIPLYCFFNFNHTSGHFSYLGDRCRHSYRGPSFWGCTLAAPEQVQAASSNNLQELRWFMRPWHELVCDYHQSSLPDAGIAFVTRMRQSTLSRAHAPDEIGKRAIPHYVRHLIGITEEENVHPETTYLDQSYWGEIGDIPGDIAGLAIFRDLDT
jgi:hypothetical protein